MTVKTELHLQAKWLHEDTLAHEEVERAREVVVEEIVFEELWIPNRAFGHAVMVFNRLVIVVRGRRYIVDSRDPINPFSKQGGYAKSRFRGDLLHTATSSGKYWANLFTNLKLR